MAGQPQPTPSLTYPPGEIMAKQGLPKGNKWLISQAPNKSKFTDEISSIGIRKTLQDAIVALYEGLGRNITMSS